VLPYLKQLVVGGIEVFLLTFEPRLTESWKPAELESARSCLADAGIRWFYLPYHKRPTLLATAYDIAQGARVAMRLVRQYGIGILHARAHIPLAIAILIQRVTRCRLIFDIRGLMAEEYADAGIWTENSIPFRAVKRLEQVGIRRADEIVVLTKRMRDWLVKHKLKSLKQIEVIPCCVDFSRFDAKAASAPQAAQERFEIVYAGSVTGLYLLEEMGKLFLKIRVQRPDAHFHIMTQSPSEEVAARLRRIGLSPEDFHVSAVKPFEVPSYLRQARLGISFRKPTFSQIAASPTKIPEYLAAGLPTICNAGIGDTDELILDEKVGVVLRAFDDESYQRVIDDALALAEDPEVRGRCERVGRAYFDLVEVGGVRYRNVYRRIIERSDIMESASEAPTWSEIE
jgi:glycosyltransferase involved in cell wall biosynthesis